MAKLSIGRAWEETKAIIARDKRLLVPLALGLLVLPTAVLGLVVPGAQLGTQERDPVTVGLTLAAAVVGLVGQLTIIRLALGFDGSLGEAIGVAARRIWVLLAAMLILVLPLVVAMVAIGGVAALGTTTTTNPRGVASIAILAIVGVFLWLAIRLLPVSVGAVAETDGPVALLKRSFAMTKGSFWRLFAFLVMTAIALLVLLAAVAIVGGTLANLLFGEPEPMTLSALVVGLLTGLVQAVVATIYAVMLTRIYVQLADGPRA